MTNSNKSLAFEIQEYACEILNSDYDLSSMGVVFYPENLLDIDYQIKNSMSRQGLACIVMTPTMNYQGHDGLTQSFTMDDFTLQIVENPVINRARLKKSGLSAGTALDVGLRAAEALAGPQSGHYGEFTTRRIEQGEDGSLIVVKAQFGTTMYREISGIISTDISGNRVEIPFVTHSEVSGLINQVDSLSSLIIGFDTEDIKLRLGTAEEDIEDIYVKYNDLCTLYTNCSTTNSGKLL